MVVATVCYGCNCKGGCYTFHSLHILYFTTICISFEHTFWLFPLFVDTKMYWLFLHPTWSLLPICFGSMMLYDACAFVLILDMRATFVHPYFHSPHCRCSRVFNLVGQPRLFALCVGLPKGLWNERLVSLVFLGAVHLRIVCVDFEWFFAHSALASVSSLTIYGNIYSKNKSSALGLNWRRDDIIQRTMALFRHAIDRYKIQTPV